VNIKIAIAIVAAIILAAVNAFLIISAFLYSQFYGDLFQIGFMLSWLVIMAFGMLLRRSLLIYAAQSVVTALLIWRIVQYYFRDYHLGQGENPFSLVYPIAMIIVGYGLAWCVARAISAKNV
jgi:hypothetical protein